MNIKVKKLSDTAKLPTYGSNGAACFDLYADSVESKEWGVVVDTGLSFEVPENHVMMVYSRSGHGFNHGIILRNGTGVIDSDYRGSVKIALTLNSGSLDFEIKDSQISAISMIKKGDRVAQAMIVPVSQSTFIEVDALTDTSRGVGGFGSTGN